MPDKELNEDENYSTFTNAPPSPAIDLKTLQAHAEVEQQYYLDIFKGVRVVVDPNLTGNAYYCAVSQEIYDALKAMSQGEDDARQRA